MSKSVKQQKAPGAVTALAPLPEMLPSQQDGVSIIDWVSGLASFFQRAQGLEQRAQATLTQARALTMPTTAAEDEALQVFVKRASADIKETEEHWEITSLVSRFHKRLVGARKRTTDALDTAKATAQRLHNTYAEQERQRVAREIELARRQEQERAEAERRKELEKLEAEALRREQASPDLSEREQAFIDRLVAHPHRDDFDVQVRIAREVGFKDGRRGPALVQMPKILAAISLALEAAALRRQATAIESTPLVVNEVEIDAQIGKGGTDRATWSAEVFDLDVFRQGVKDGLIPMDAILPNGPVLNAYARSLHENLNRWPGVRAIRKVTTV